MTRRGFSALSVVGLRAGAAWAQHAAVTGPAPADTVWLNANENPEGPPPECREAIARAIAEAGRYNHRVFPVLHEALAKLAGVDSALIIPGAGSTEVLHCAVDAFTTAARPLITVWPTWEMTRDLAAAAGRPVVKVPLTAQWSADVERLADAARKARGGVIHLGNPNNPTSSVTPRAELQWLVENLPADTVLLIDEAYIQFVDSPAVESGVRYVREGRNVVVTRTFSKLYGMAGVRVGFGCAPAALVKQMQPFRNNVISILGARAAMAAVPLGDAFVSARRTRRNHIRAALCQWLDQRGFHYIPPNANFVLIEIGREVSEAIPRMLAEGVAVGRRFDGVERWMRVAVGTEQEMEKFQAAFRKVVG
ncbi:MAG: aminotransferase class I/II-fold pyridoxal phosphate-dependent enzyme [Acidobacteriia bacterium]|nr:aminotransferase class I/II-fold pyridoxal phosphate-dependent enzyme [Terriglobia bacterium]